MLCKLTVLSPLCSNVIKPDKMQFCTKPNRNVWSEGLKLFFNNQGFISTNLQHKGKAQRFIFIVSFIVTLGRRRQNFMQLFSSRLPEPRLTVQCLSNSVCFQQSAAVSHSATHRATVLLLLNHFLLYYSFPFSSHFPVSPYSFFHSTLLLSSYLSALLVHGCNSPLCHNPPSFVFLGFSRFLSH